MRRFSCARCGAAFPLNDGIAIGDRTLCEPCVNEEYSAATSSEVEAAAPERLVDPTVCARCGTDWGSSELPRIAGLPMCSTCESALRHRPFPPWLGPSLAALAMLAVLSLWHHQRFLLGYRDLVRANAALRREDLAAAVQAFEAAARRVPEDTSLQATASLFRGIALMHADKSAEAVPFLAQAHATYPGDRGIERMLRSAEGGAAFDSGDYALFLEKQRAVERLAPGDAMAAAGVASALACLYADGGDETLRAQALAQLAEGAGLVRDDGEAFREYEERVHHRLATREILSAEEYRRRFPDGRSPQDEP